MTDRNRIDAERALLRALQSRASGRVRIKCDVILRQTLGDLDKYSDAAEVALCLNGSEEPETWRLYSILRQLIWDGYAEGAGDLRSPAGPRYTECGILTKGMERLSELEKESY